MKSRNTRQKEKIEKVVTAQTGFFNAEELYEIVKDDDISLATIYRHLKQLVSDGSLFVYTCDRRQVYSKTKQHCHYISADGTVTHFEIDNLDFLKAKVPGKIASFSIEVREG